MGDFAASIKGSAPKVASITGKALDKVSGMFSGPQLEFAAASAGTYSTNSYTAFEPADAASIVALLKQMVSGNSDTAKAIEQLGEEMKSSPDAANVYLDATKVSAVLAAQAKTVNKGRGVV